MRIPLLDIAIINRQRRNIDQTKLQSLMNSIMVIEQSKGVGNGLLHPITVRRRTDADLYDADYPDQSKRGKPVTEPWILLTGGRRTAAHWKLARPDIEARDFGELPVLEQRVIELMENVEREDLTWQERLSAEAEVHRIRMDQATSEGRQHTQKDTGKELNVSHATISRDLALVSLIERNPELAKAPTKKAALRKAEFHAAVGARVKAIKHVDVSDLRSRLQTRDMRDYVRDLADNSVDLHFSDFPFGIDYDKVRPDNETQKGSYRDDPDTVRDLLADVVLEIVRTVKPTGWAACMMGWTNYQFLAGLFRTACKAHHAYARPTYQEDGSIVRREDHCTEGNKFSSPCVFLEPEFLPWYWYRPNSRNPSLWPEMHAKNEMELICVVNGGKARLVRPGVGNVLMFDANYNDRLHEMQRPHDLCKEIIGRLTYTGELVVDLCFGSGAHLAAAADMARNFAGCDINPENLGAALGLVAQYYKGSEVMKAIKSQAETARRQAQEAAELDAAELISDEEAESVGL